MIKAYFVGQREGSRDVAVRLVAAHLLVERIAPNRDAAQHLAAKAIDELGLQATLVEAMERGRAIALRNGGPLS